MKYLLNLLTLLCCLQVLAQKPLSKLPIVQGSVLSSEILGDTLFIGGNFNRIFTPSTTSHYGSLINTSTGKVDGLFPQPNGNVYAVITDGQNGWYIGGSFTKFGDSIRANLVHIDSLGNISSWNPNPNGAVRALYLDGNELFVGGQFSAIGGQQRKSIAIFNTQTGICLPWDPQMHVNSNVNSICVKDSIVYVTGNLVSIGDSVRWYLGAINRYSKLATIWNPQPDQPVNLVYASGNRIYVGGNFNNIAGVTRGKVAVFDAVSGNILNWNPNADRPVYIIKCVDSLVYLGGQFTQIGLSERKGLARVNVFSGIVSSWNPAVSGYVYGIEIKDKVMYVAGSFNKIGLQDRLHIGAVNTTDGGVILWNPFEKMQANNEGIYTIAINGNKIFAGGKYINMGGVKRPYLAAINLRNGELFNWDIKLNSSVSNFAVSGTTIFLAGLFDSINNIPRKWVGAVDRLNGNLMQWNPKPDLPVRSLVSAGKTLYLSGPFTQLGNVQRYKLAAVDNITGLVIPWNPCKSSDNIQYFNNMCLVDSILYVVGSFSSIGGFQHDKLAAININSGNVRAWNPTFNGTVNNLYAHGNTLFISGGFSEGLVSFNSTTGIRNNWNFSGFGISSMTAKDTVLYLIGGFTTINGKSRKQLAAVHITSGNLLSWDPNVKFDDAVNCFAVGTNELIIGGGFDYVNDTFNGGLYRVEGMPLNADMLILNKDTIVVSADSSLQSVSMTINNQNRWNVSYTSDWINAENTNGNYAQPLQLKIAANTTAKKRTAIVGINAGTEHRQFFIAQNPGPPQLNISIDTLYFSSGAQSKMVTVTCNTSWTVNALDSWISVNPSMGENNGTTSISVVENSGTSPRISSVLVKADTITKKMLIVQDGKVGIADQDLLNRIIQIGPNPCSGELFIKNNSNEDVRCDLYNIRGIRVKQMGSIKSQSGIQELLNVQPGIYLLEVTGMQMQKRFKIVVY